MILIDTNVLARLPNGADPQRDLAKAAIARLKGESQVLVIAPQCLYEFWVIATRPPADNGLGFSGSRAGQWVQFIKRLGLLLPDDLRVCQRWENLVIAHNTTGKPAHDAHLVAWMLVNNVASVLTFNAKDFARYGITVIDPRNVAAK